MQLNLPILHLLENSQNILIAGAGGGFDVFAGLPLYFALRQMGKRVHLANYSFSFQWMNPALFLTNPEVLTDDALIGARGKVRLPLPYFPEGYLAQWLEQVYLEEIPVWMIKRVGPRLLLPLYQQLTEHLKIDAIILVDGGVDSLMIGDEQRPGTLLEDTISLMTVQELDIPVKILACLGFGSEEEVSHHNALENMAALMKQNACYGACALTQAMPVYQEYEAACRYVWEQDNHVKSHISTRVVSAVLGEFGDYHLYDDDKRTTLYISPLMSLYWFFDAEQVIKRSLIADSIRYTETFDEALRQTLQQMSNLAGQMRRDKPIPY